MKVMGALDLDNLTISQKKELLRAINLVKLKRSVKLKQRMCADGRPHIFYITK